MGYRTWLSHEEDEVHESHAQHESNGCDKGHEVDATHEEGKEGERHRQGQEVAYVSVQWHQGEDLHWPHQGNADQEQERQDRVQEGLCEQQEEIRHQRQDCTGQGLVRENQGTLEVNAPAVWQLVVSTVVWPRGRQVCRESFIMSVEVSMQLCVLCEPQTCICWPHD